MIPNVIKFALTAIVVFVSITLELEARPIQDSEQTESDRLESYLESLNLDRMVIEQLELRMAGQVDPRKREVIARRLIEHYVDQMLLGTESASREHANLKQLLLIYPKLSTYSTRLALLQSQYGEAEKQFREWWEQGQPNKTRNSVISEFQAVESELAIISRTLEAEYQERVSAMQTLPEVQEADSIKALQSERYLLQSNYLQGWTEYFLGVLVPDRRETYMARSDSFFRKFLQVEPNQTLNDVAPAWFDLSSDWNIRALAGLGMSQRGLGHDDQADYCFEQISDQNTALSSRSTVFIWQMNSRLYLGDYSGFQKTSLQLIRSSVSDSGRVSFWTEVLRGYSAIRESAPARAQGLLENGLSGLARNFQVERIETFLTDYNVKLTDLGFAQNWVAGYVAMEQYFRGDVNDINEAKHRLEMAMSFADAETNPIDKACCQFLLAKISFEKKHFEQAGEKFLEVANSIYTDSPDLATEAQWSAVLAYSEFAKQKPRNLFQAIEAIDQTIVRFAGSEIAKKAQFEKIRINNARLAPEVAIKNLSKISPNDLNYSSALNETVKLRYQIWKSALTDEKKASQSLDDLKRAELAFRKQNVLSKAKLKNVLLVTDALVRTKSISENEIREYLDIAFELANSISESSPIYKNYRFYELQFAVKINDQATVENEANWLIENSVGSKEELSALIQLARIIDQRLSETTEPGPILINNAIEIFKKLSDRLGTSDSNLKSTPNARVAYFRLAELTRLAGKLNEAETLLINLNRLFPKHVLYLRQLALVRTEANNFKEAVPLWKMIIVGVDSGTDAWFEGKYHLAHCLASTNQIEDAKKLLEQTIRLGGQLPEKWKQRIETKMNDLEQSLSRSGNE